LLTLIDRKTDFNPGDIMTPYLSVLKENPYFCRYQVFSSETLETQETPFYFQLYPLHFNQQVVVFSKRLADSFRSTPQNVQDMATLVLRELLLHPEDIIWIEKSFSPFDKSQPVFNRIIFEWQDGEANNPRWVENLTAKTVVLNDN
jgi:hypothetical protein